MEERQVTVDGTSYNLPEPFFVIATQNPIEQQGTYDLPEAQLDRFMLRISIGYPPAEQEADILEAQRAVHPLKELEHVATPEDILWLQGLTRQVFFKPSLRRYVVALSHASREHADVMVGVSVRGSRQLMHAAQALALINRREYVIPDDIQEMARVSLPHRIVVRPEARLAGISEPGILDAIISQTEVPAQ
jgi:MoxR-like ATPase